MLPGCSDEEGGGTTPTGDGLATLVVSLQAENSSEPVGTRAAGDPTETEEEENNYERQIEHWWVLIYNDEGFVDYLSDTNSPATTPSGDDSEFSTSIELPIGSYRLYGFANLGTLEDTDLISSLTNGSVSESDLVADRATLAGKAVNLGDVLEKFNVAADSRPTIPMSSYSEKITLEEDAQNEVTLELYRMIGKVRLEVTNQTGNSITLNKFSMKNFRMAGNIFLMPYDGLDKVGKDEIMTDAMQPIFPKGAATTATYGAYTYTVNEEIENNNSQPKRYSFYVSETPQEGQENGSSPMMLSFDIQGRPEESIRQTIFNFVRRNDLLKIPVNISNIDTKISYSNQDTPIGGLPNVVWQTEDGISIDEPIYVVAPRDDAGPVEIQYEFQTIANYGVEDIHIRYKATNVNTGLAYSEATVVSNVEDGKDYGLLIDPEKMTVLPNDTEITLVPDGETTTSDDNTETIGGAKGKILVYTQELTNNASATIRLNLVAICTNEDQTTTEVEIPYTIVVQNYSSTTTN